MKIAFGTIAAFLMASSLAAASDDKKPFTAAKRNLVGGGTYCPNGYKLLEMTFIVDDDVSTGPPFRVGGVLGLDTIFPDFDRDLQDFVGIDDNGEGSDEEGDNEGSDEAPQSGANEEKPEPIPSVGSNAFGAMFPEDLFWGASFGRFVSFDNDDIQSAEYILLDDAICLVANRCYRLRGFFGSTSLAPGFGSFNANFVVKFDGYSIFQINYGVLPPLSTVTTGDIGTFGDYCYS